VRRLEDMQWTPSLLDLSLGPRDVQEIPSGEVFALTDTALLVRGR